MRVRVPLREAPMIFVPGTILAVLFASGTPGLQDRALSGQLDARPLEGKRLPRISGGMMHALRQGAGAAAAAALQSRSGGTDARDLGLSRGTLGCGARNTDGNVRVNQDCGYRPQNETIIKYDPNDTDNFVAGMNDYRTGEGFQGFAFSLDGGRSWGDGIVPFTNHRNQPQPGHTVLGGPGTE